MLNSMISGEDRSYIYQYFASPLATYLVSNCTPTWLAPNVITIVGFLLVVFSAVLVYSFAPLFERGTVPEWIWILCGILLFVYHTLDNMDGKQARKTGSSSPLGLICDHGCDCLNAFISSLTFAACVGYTIDEPLPIFLCFLNGAVPFFCATFEEFYVGKLVFGEINGPNEGVFLLIGMYVTTGILGQSIWNDVRYNPLLGLGLAPGLVTAILNVHTAIQHQVKNKGSVVEPMVNLTPILSLAGLGLGWMLLSPSLVALHPRTFFLYLGLCLYDMTTDLMLRHILQKPYNPFRVSLIPLLLGVINASNGYFLDQYVSEEQFLTIAAQLITLKVVHFSVFVAYEIRQIMGIRVFHIKKE